MNGSILEGIPYYGELAMIPMGKWLFLFAFFFLILCRKQTKYRPLTRYAMYRYGNFDKWWRHHFCGQYGYFSICFWFCCLLRSLVEIVCGEITWEVIETELFFFLHLSVYIGIIIFCDFIWKNNYAPCVLLVIEGMLYVFSVDYKMPALSCGMYMHCSYSKIGIWSVVLCILKLLLIWGCYISVPCIWKKEMAEREM